jgi:hypothetical protein
MQPALLNLDPVAPGHFLGSDGRFEIDVPTGSVTSDDLVTAGGQLDLSLRQIAPASGSTGGGNGLYSFGTFLVQTVDGLKHEWQHMLRKPLTFKLHVSPREHAFNLAGTVVVFNGTRTRQGHIRPWQADAG